MRSGSVRSASARSTPCPGGGGAFRRRACPCRIPTVAAVAAATFLSACDGWDQSAPAAQLPSLPDLSGRTEAVRTHLTGADHAARADPDSPDTVGALGMAYHADLYYDRAVRSYALAEALDPDGWKWTYYRALAHASRGDDEQARAALRAVVEAAPDSAPAWRHLGDVDFKAGRSDEASRAWRRVMALPEPELPPPAVAAGYTPIAPLSAYAAFGLARLALAGGDPLRAAELLEAATAEAPRFGPAFRLLGDALAALGRHEEASRARRRADRSPRYAPYLDPLFYRLIDESRSGAFLLQQASTADLTTNAAWREQLVRRALALDPDHPDALFDLATMLRVLRRYDEALALLERHRRLYPGDFQVIADIGRCLSGLRRYAAAEPLLRQALEGLDTAETRYDLALVLERGGRLDEAVSEYERALDRNPSHVGALNNLGVALARQGRFAPAIRRFEQAVAVAPDNADAHVNLGALLLAQGAREPARRAFRTALELDPGHAGAADGLRRLEQP